ncbi:hypothetical protein E4665_03095 [Sporolactobacillus shoreae]|uniref:Uncharacterized protein n=1 Tax=Sporolactobacillus shoreae TaxID=1465501 RepID=A0A4Z0GRK5_9BACL|nr:hypothetical protein [Sporolactobacillus shoreae]TGA99949.1 hypothetical protein E4665_03095 [Sporolactobacillus shoreae]
MKKFAFYLHPKGDAIRGHSPVFFSVIVSDSVEQAAQKLSVLNQSVYCGLLKVTSNKYHVYFSKSVPDANEEFMYIVIEDPESKF